MKKQIAFFLIYVIIFVGTVIFFNYSVNTTNMIYYQCGFDHKEIKFLKLQENTTNLKILNKILENCNTGDNLTNERDFGKEEKQILKGKLDKIGISLDF